jgi:hypothetical protein
VGVFKCIGLVGVLGVFVYYSGLVLSTHNVVYCIYVVFDVVLDVFAADVGW